MDDDAVSKALAQLRYLRQWLSFGLLDEAGLLRQIERQRDLNDPYPEHRRYESFLSILSDHSELDATTIDRYIELAELDEDRQMAISAVIQLVQWPNLPVDQVERLGLHPYCAEPVIQNAIRRRLGKT
ncbi:MAG: hypothetical protein ACR2JW_00725 [Thermomicrobiales bacterium]